MLDKSGFSKGRQQDLLYISYRMKSEIRKPPRSPYHNIDYNKNNTVGLQIKNEKKEKKRADKFLEKMAARCVKY